MNKQILFATVLSLAVQAGFARESWPVAGGADKQRQEDFKLHEQEVLSNVAPALIEWEKKGKPFIPWAAKPEDLSQASVPAFPGAEGGGKFSFGGRGGKFGQRRDAFALDRVTARGESEWTPESGPIGDAVGGGF